MTTTTPNRTRPAASTRPQTRADTTGPGRRRREAATRARAAADLAAAGLPYTRIAKHLGYATPGSAHRAATRARLADTAGPVIDTRAAILAALDQVIRRSLDGIDTPRPRMYRGRPILTDPDDPSSTVPDWRHTLRMVDIGVRALDQQSKLLGLYVSHPGPQISRVHSYR